MICMEPIFERRLIQGMIYTWAHCTYPYFYLGAVCLDLGLTDAASLYSIKTCFIRFLMISLQEN